MLPIPNVNADCLAFQVAADAIYSSAIVAPFHVPDVIVPTGGYIIPKETPFALEGYSSPMYPEYTFNWEQNDATSEVFWNDTENSEYPFFVLVLNGGRIPWRESECFVCGVFEECRCFGRGW